MTPDDVTHATPDAVWHCLQQDPNAVLLDVRTRMEYEYVGHPIGAVHVAYSEWPTFAPEPGFVDAVGKALQDRGNESPQTVRLFTICRSGTRSLAAARALRAAGYAAVVNVAEGFEGERDGARHRSTVNGWRARGLPWEQT